MEDSSILKENDVVIYEIVMDVIADSVGEDDDDPLVNSGTTNAFVTTGS